jgi:hypothetical protein
MDTETRNWVRSAFGERRSYAGGAGHHAHISYVPGRAAKVEPPPGLPDCCLRAMQQQSARRGFMDSQPRARAPNDWPGEQWQNSHGRTDAPGISARRYLVSLPSARASCVATKVAAALRPPGTGVPLSTCVAGFEPRVTPGGAEPMPTIGAAGRSRIAR